MCRFIALTGAKAGPAPARMRETVDLIHLESFTIADCDLCGAPAVAGTCGLRMRARPAGCSPNRTTDVQSPQDRRENGARSWSRRPRPGDVDAEEDREAAEPLNGAHRLCEDQPAETRRRDRLEKDDQRGESRRQPAERDRQEPLAARVADPGHGEERCEAAQRMGQQRALGDKRDDEQDRRRHDRRLEGEPRRGGRPARRLNGEEVEAEEHAGRDAVEIADRAGAA